MAVDTQYYRMKKAADRRYYDGYDDYPEDIVRSFSRGGGESSRELAARGNRYEDDRRAASREYDRQRRDRDRERDRGESRERRYDGDRQMRERSRDALNRNGGNGYSPLTSAELVQGKSDTPTLRRADSKLPIHSDDGDFDMDKWRELASMGELDVYTCLGLSDATTWTVDTQKLLFKIVAVMTMQLIVPALMLYVEILKLSNNDPSQALQVAELVNHLKPARAGVAFRGIGFTMILYSLYSMYKNALDECRASALHFCLQEGVKCGIWWPLMVGEFVNVCVSVILIIAMYFIFINITDGADLILNALAVNFLGDVDGEFVDREAYTDAVANFDILMEKYKDKPRTARPCWGRLLENFLQLLLVIFLLLGVIIAVIFLFSPTKDGTPWYEGY